MESIDYWEDSQYDSMVEFDDSINMLVRDSIGIGEEPADAMIEALGDVIEAIVEDSGEGVIEAIVEYSGEEIASLVEDTFCDGWDMASGVAVACPDKKLEPLVNFKRVKTRVSASRPKVIHDFDLNKPSAEEKLLAANYKGGRDFDLNKLPIAGMFQLADPSQELDFIEMLRLLLPSFYW